MVSCQSWRDVPVNGRTVRSSERERAFAVWMVIGDAVVIGYSRSRR